MPLAMGVYVLLFRISQSFSRRSTETEQQTHLVLHHHLTSQYWGLNAEELRHQNQPQH